MKKLRKKTAYLIAIYLITGIGIAVAQFVTTGGPVIPPFPTVGPTHPVVSGGSKVEAVFVLDTTGSMSGLIQGAKEKIWSIASTLGSAQQNPNVKIGLVAFRDKGDTYVTRRFDLTSNLDEMYTNLMSFSAHGGGDGPEDVNRGLHDAVNHFSWSQGENVYKVIFLVGDAPPHMDYGGEAKYPQIIKMATRKGITINAIQCGNQSNTKSAWMKIAKLSQGKYFNVNQSGGALIASSPFDDRITKLSRELDKTRMAFGDKEKRMKAESTFSLSDTIARGASVIANAGRAVFSVSKAGEKSFLGENELVDKVMVDGKADEGVLAAIPEKNLPPALVGLSMVEKKNVIAKKANKRKTIRQEIKKLAKLRQDHLEAFAKKSGADKDSFEAHIYDAVKVQSKGAGLRYGSGPSY